MTRIICLEGITGAGKTVQARRLDNYLLNIGSKYLIINEKQYSPFKEVVIEWHYLGANQRFSKADVLRFAKARAETHRRYFIPLFKKLDYIIFDRSLYTSGVYQTSEKLSCEEIIDINLEEGAIKPQEGFIFNCSPELALDRTNIRRLQKDNYFLPSINENITEITKRRQLYLQLARDHPELYLIDSKNKEEDIFNEIKRKIGL